MCSIEDLPYEVLAEILSNLSVKDILSSAERVCRRWKEACHDIHTWKHQLFQPGKKNAYAIIMEVQRMPKLQRLLLENVLENDFFTAVISACRHLRTLILSSDCGFDYEMMQTLRTNCPNIEQLQIPIAKTGGNLILDEVARLANLKTLILWSFNFGRVDVKLLADGCPSLVRISFWGLRTLKEDLVYFLQKKGGTLRQLEIECSMVEICLLPLLSTCKKLDRLKIICYCMLHEILRRRHMHRANIRNREDEGLEMALIQPLDLQNLQTVTSLSLDYIYFPYSSDRRGRKHAMELFRNHCVSQLVSLNLHLQGNQPKEIIDSVTENCPLLKRLHLVCGSSLTDDCLMKLSSLPLLEDVSLEGSNISEDSIGYLSSCRSLQYLNLKGCSKLGEGAMRKLVTLSNLKRLILDECDVRGFPFHVVSDHMKNLTYISLYKSKHVDWKGVEKLKEKSPLVTIVQEPPIEYANCSPMLGKFPLEDPVPRSQHEVSSS